MLKWIIGILGISLILVLNVYYEKEKYEKKLSMYNRQVSMGNH